MMSRRRLWLFPAVLGAIVLFAESISRREGVVITCVGEASDVGDDEIAFPGVPQSVPEFGDQSFVGPVFLAAAPAASSARPPEARALSPPCAA